MSTTELIIRFALALAALLPLAIYFMAAGKTGLRAAIFKEKASIGGPTRADMVKYYLSSAKDKDGNSASKPEPAGLAAHIEDANLKTVRQNDDFQQFMKDDTEPVFDRFPTVNTRKMLRLMLLAIPAIFVVGLLSPIAAAVLSITWSFVALTFRNRAKSRFVPVWETREALVAKAYDIVDPFLKIGLGLGKPYMAHHWIVVPEWEGTTPERFQVMLPPTYSPTETQRALVQDAWEERMSARSQASWGWEWRLDQGYVLIKPFPPLPSMARLPFPADPELPWNKIPLGMNNRGRPVTWDIAAAPHAIIMGRTGQGKSIQLNAILIDVLQDPMWSVYIADRKDALDSYTVADGCFGFESSYEGILDMFRNIQAENERRKQILKANGFRKWQDLPPKIKIDGEIVDRPPLIMLIVEEAIDLLAGAKGMKEVNALKDEMKSLLLQMVATSRSQGIFIVMVIQRPDAEFTGGAFRENIGCRIQVGAMGGSASRMLFETEVPERYFLKDASLEDDEANLLKGRAAFSTAIGSYSIIQGYFADDNDEPLRRTLMQANRIRANGGTRKTLRRNRSENVEQQESGDSKVVEFLNKVLGVVRLETHIEETTAFDDEEGEEVVRKALKFRRIPKVATEENEEEAATEEVPSRRPKAHEVADGDKPRNTRADNGELLERLRQRRIAQQERTAARNGEQPPVQGPAASAPVGLPIATFAEPEAPVAEPAVEPMVLEGTEEPSTEETVVEEGVITVPEPVTEPVVEPSEVVEDVLYIGDRPVPGVRRGAAPQPAAAPKVAAPVDGVTEEGSWF